MNTAARSQPSFLSPEQSCALQTDLLYLPRHMAEDGYTVDPKFCHVPHFSHAGTAEPQCRILERKLDEPRSDPL